MRRYASGSERSVGRAFLAWLQKGRDALQPGKVFRENPLQLSLLRVRQLHRDLVRVMH